EPWTWAPIADLNQPRAEHTATLLANGTVLIAGGRDAAGQPLASAEIYDPATGGYTLLASPLPAPVWGHTATRLSDGTVLIAGGRLDGLGRPRFRGTLRPDGWHRQPGWTAQRPAHAGQRRALARRHRARRRRPDDDERGP